MTDINKLRKLLEKTPGPWKYTEISDQEEVDLCCILVNSLPAMLNELETLRSRVAVLERVQEAAIAVVDHARGTAMSMNWMPVLAQQLTRLECALDSANNKNS